MERDKTILHCDLNGFFASVEGLSRPDLRDVPMAVAGDPKNRHGIILAKNEPAKKYGISTGEPVVYALKKCPNLVLLPAHHDKYEEYSKKVNAIYLRFTEKVEPFGIDESWLDVTNSRTLFGDGKQIADKLRETVKAELGLTISVGVSYTKAFAKLGSDYKKPDATTVFDRVAYKTIVRALPVGNLLYVGRAVSDELMRMGIATIGELADANPALLSRRLGKNGLDLIAMARGEGDSPVRVFGDSPEAKSVGNSITFARDLVGESDFKVGARRVAEKVARRMKEESFLYQTVKITIKSADFKVIVRQCRLSSPTNSMRELLDVSMRLLRDNWDFSKPVRMLGITATDLMDANKEISPIQEQGELFENPSLPAKSSLEKMQRVSRAEDAFFAVRKKFGKGAIGFANMMDSDLNG